MNKEILFRGFHPDENGFEKVFVNGKWIKGIWVEGAYMPHYYSSRYGKISAIFVNDDVEGKTYRYSVIPETVGQYIDKTDKNRKKIFDGDILKGYIYPFYASDDNTFNYYAVVIWFEETCSYRLVTIKAPDLNRRGISEGNDSSFEEFQSEDWEIIGNVHDNSDLLPKWILSWL